MFAIVIKRYLSQVMRSLSNELGHVGRVPWIDVNVSVITGLNQFHDGPDPGRGCSAWMHIGWRRTIGVWTRWCDVSLVGGTRLSATRHIHRLICCLLISTSTWSSPASTVWVFYDGSRWWRKTNVVISDWNTTQYDKSHKSTARLDKLFPVTSCLITEWRREGAKGACAPGGIVQVAAFGGAKMWNYEIWPLLANWRLHCRQWY